MKGRERDKRWRVGYVGERTTNSELFAVQTRKNLMSGLHELGKFRKIWDGYTFEDGELLLFCGRVSYVWLIWGKTFETNYVSLTLNLLNFDAFVKWIWTEEIWGMRTASRNNAMSHFRRNQAVSEKMNLAFSCNYDEQPCLVIRNQMTLLCNAQLFSTTLSLANVYY